MTMCGTDLLVVLANTLHELAHSLHGLEIPFAPSGRREPSLPSRPCYQAWGHGARAPLATL